MPPSKLFHTIVIVGAAATSPACSEAEPSTPGAGARADGGLASDAAVTADGGLLPRDGALALPSQDAAFAASSLMNDGGERALDASVDAGSAPPGATDAAHSDAATRPVFEPRPWW